MSCERSWPNGGGFGAVQVNRSVRMTRVAVIGDVATLLDEMRGSNSLLEPDNKRWVLRGMKPGPNLHLLPEI